MNKFKFIIYFLPFFALHLISCAQQGDGRGSESSTEGLALKNSDFQSFMSRLSSRIVSRPLTASEIILIDEEGSSALASIVEAWSSEEGFSLAARVYIEKLIGTGGSEKNGINFALPGNLIEYIVKNNLPYSEIIKADYCVDGSMQKISCDTGAPYAAGVLATRAFLSSNVSRFNLHRAAVLVDKFLCDSFPLDTSLQGQTPKDYIIPLFRPSSAAEHTDEVKNETVTNGEDCYSCHSQFSEFTQLFVKFDDKGVWSANATGLQDPNKEPGRSSGGFFVSHLDNPNAAFSEQAYIFKKGVANMSEAAKVIATNKVFLECAVEDYLAYLFGVVNAQELRGSLGAEIVAQIENETNEAKFIDIVKAILTNEKVIAGVVAGAKE